MGEVVNLNHAPRVRRDIDGLPVVRPHRGRAFVDDILTVVGAVVSIAVVAIIVVIAVCALIAAYVVWEAFVE